MVVNNDKAILCIERVQCKQSVNTFIAMCVRRGVLMHTHNVVDAINLINLNPYIHTTEQGGMFTPHIPDVFDCHLVYSWTCVKRTIRERSSFLWVK